VPAVDDVCRFGVQEPQDGATAFRDDAAERHPALRRLAEVHGNEQ
jgi:hypothetical protein